jgi:serine/threonine protein kinase
MNFNPPADDLILEQFTEIGKLTQFDQGGFKAVYRAEIGSQTEVFKLVCLPTEDGSDEVKAYRKECLSRILREIDLLGKLTRPEIVKLASLPARIVTIDGVEYVGYSEELLEGDSLLSLIKGLGGKPDEREAHLLLGSLLTAIEEIWSHKAIHRDINPRNIIRLAVPDRRFVLLDLGIAYLLSETGVTRDPAFAPFTPRYFAPEMAKPDFRQNLDYRSDLYTAALTVFEYSAQMHPLARTRDDLIQTLSRALHQAPRLLKTERPDFSDDFCELIDQLLKKKPALRPSDFTNIRSRLSV